MVRRSSGEANNLTSHFMKPEGSLQCALEPAIILSQNNLVQGLQISAIKIHFNSPIINA
jgi:hypothetical protein